MHLSAKIPVTVAAGIKLIWTLCLRTSSAPRAKYTVCEQKSHLNFNCKIRSLTVNFISLPKSVTNHLIISPLDIQIQHDSSDHNNLHNLIPSALESSTTPLSLGKGHWMFNVHTDCYITTQLYFWWTVLLPALWNSSSLLKSKSLQLNTNWNTFYNVQTAPNSY